MLYIVSKFTAMSVSQLCGKISRTGGFSVISVSRVVLFCSDIRYDEYILFIISKRPFTLPVKWLFVRFTTHPYAT